MSPPASPQQGPPPHSWLAQLLQVCLADPTTSLHLPPYLRTALLGPLNNESLEFNEPLYMQLGASLLVCTKTSAPSWSIFQLVSTMKESMDSVTFRLYVQEPFFSQLKDGSKVIEGRCAAGTYNSILPGDVLLFNDKLIAVVKKVNHFCSFYEMLEVEGMDRVLPGVTSIEEGVAIYRSFYSKEKEFSRGVLAIYVKRIDEERQPLTLVENMLRELATWDVKALHQFVLKI